MSAYKLVPVEPTDEMLNAGKREAHGNNGARDKAQRIYRAMLAAAPQPEQQPVEWQVRIRHAEGDWGSWQQVQAGEGLPVYQARAAKWPDKYEIRALYAAPAPAADVRGLVEALRWAHDWIDRAPHGENCFVSANYEGDPGNRCNCDKEAILAALEPAIAKHGGAQ